MWMCHCVISSCVGSWSIGRVFHGIKSKNQEKAQITRVNFTWNMSELHIKVTINIAQMVRANFTWTKMLRAGCGLEGS